MREILNASYAGSQFSSIRSAAVACIVDHLTVMGSVSEDDALETVEQDGAISIIKEMGTEYGYDTDQMVAIEDHWDDAIEVIKSRV